MVECSSHDGGVQALAGLVRYGQWDVYVAGSSGRRSGDLAWQRTVLVRRFVVDMEAPFEVVADAHAPYFGATLSDDSLVARRGAQCCSMGFDAWLRHSGYARANW
jgi:hypothetical protein